jgi:nicotinamidase-related amidase
MSQTALLVQDLQNGIVDMVADESVKEPYLKRVAAAISAARKAGIKVIYVVVAFRPGYPEISPDNPRFSQVKSMGAFVEGDRSTKVHDLVAPAENEPIVVKRRVSGFLNTDLEAILRSAGVRNLVLTGIATSGVVLSSLRHASDMDYKVTVLEDLCLDRDPEVHKVLMEKVFTSQAKVQSSEEWIASLGA